MFVSSTCLSSVHSLATSAGLDCARSVTSEMIGPVFTGESEGKRLAAVYAGEEAFKDTSEQGHGSEEAAPLVSNRTRATDM